MPYLFIPLILLLLQAAGAQAAPAAAPADPFPAPPPLVQRLSPEIIFNVLAGEVAAHRHRLEDSFRYYRQAAEQTGDPQLAERSARLALFNKDQQALREVVEFWVKRDPNSLEARRFALSVALELGADGEVKQQLDELIQLAQAKQEDGFILVARALSKSKEQERALQLMDGLVRAHPSQRDAWYAYALLAAEQKAYAKAEPALQELLKIAPGWDKAILLEVQVLIAQERSQQALQLLREAVTGAPDNKELRDSFARLLIQNQQYQEAYDQFQHLLKADGDSTSLRYPLGVLAMELEKYDLAEQHFQAIKDSRGRRNEASFYLGRIAEQRKDRSKALDWYRRVLDGEFQLQARIRIADLLAGLGQLAQARDELRSVRSQWTEQSPAIYAAEAGLLKEQGVAAEEIWALFEEALPTHPDHIDLLYSRALFAASQRQVARLEQDLARVLQQNPQHADALNALGYSLTDLTDRHQEALGYISQALALKPDSPAILDSMGWVQYRLGNPTKALEYLRQAAAKVTDAEISAHLGEVLWVTGAQEEARAVWSKAKQEFPDHPILQETLKRLGVQLP
ncbi:MAG: tetratricopeptide repeat protein [Gammaproteobacteria bacterium]|nr:tetratricopeptide repeat protein [Gammaproteobacteria bacterium]